MIEAANTDGKITQEELNKISYSLINVFKEDSNTTIVFIEDFFLFSNKLKISLKSLLI